eukprot:UN10210
MGKAYIVVCKCMQCYIFQEMINHMTHMFSRMIKAYGCQKHTNKTVFCKSIIFDIQFFLSILINFIL